MSETTTSTPDLGGGGDYTPDELAGAALPPDTLPAPEPAEASEPAPSDASEPAPEAPKQRPERRVSLDALHEERRLRQEAEDRFRTLETRQQQIQDYLLRQAQGQQQPQQRAPGSDIPDIDTDPVGHFRAKTEMLERQLREVREPVQQQAQASQFERAVRSQVDAFAAETPDYGEAYAFAKEQMRRDALAYGDDPNAAELYLAQRALQQGKNVGEMVYAFAKAKGYTPAAQRQAAPQAPDMAALQRGQQASRSVGAGGQPAGRGELTPERLASMSAKELSKIPDDQFKRIMGG